MSLASGSGISCPDGGSFYVCEGNTTQFLGCCVEDPCAEGSGLCAAGSLRSTSYSSSLYDAIPQQACVGGGSSSSAGDWYTCAHTSPPFLGCCLSNPCQAGGCYGGNLTAARLSDDATKASAFETASASASASSSSSQTMHMTSLSTGAIVGIAIGSAVAALVVGVALFCLYKRYERKRNQQMARQGQPGPNGSPGVYITSPYQDSNGFPSPQFYSQGGEKMGGSMPNSPGQASQVRRPASKAASWFSGRFSSHGRVPSETPSISSLGSSQGGLHVLYNQQRSSQQQQSLNTVSEMDGAEIPRPTWELAGSPPSRGVAVGHVYGAGYRHVATTEEHGA